MGQFANSDRTVGEPEELREVLDDPSFEQGMRWLDRAFDAAALHEADPGQLKREARLRIGQATLGYALHKIGHLLDQADEAIRP